ncbi:MAG: DUF3380 domain-containing protein [Flavobacterium sp.]|nr:MAG: DUF3380 domain-containing protein [Flavobacterium sp.]
MKYLTNSAIASIAKEFGLAFAKVKSIVVVESGSQAYDEETGKILIQFEPAWFKRQSPYTPSGAWSLNKVEKQAAEWKAFNDAFAKNPDAAMESTSIGLMQVLGLHWRRLGFKSVGAMWDYAKESAENQLRLGLMFIRLNKSMFQALVDGNWAKFAYFYNGEKYVLFNYDNRLAAQFEKWKTYM